MTYRKRLRGSAIDNHLTVLGEELTGGQLRKLRAIAERLGADGSIRLGDALVAIGAAPVEGLTALTHLRAALRTAALAVDRDFTLVVDDAEIPHADSRCWFAGTETLADQLEPLSREVLAHTEVAEPIGLRAVLTCTRITLCYADADRALAGKLRDHLLTQLRLRRGGDFDVWERGSTPLGVDLDAELARRLAESDIVVVLVSPEYIAHRSAELAATRAHARLLDVALRDLPSGPGVDLGGVDEQRMYRPMKMAFADISAKHQRIFAQELAERIAELAEHSARLVDATAHALADRSRDDEQLPAYPIVLRAVPEAMSNAALIGDVAAERDATAVPRPADPVGPNTFEILPRLVDWALDPRAPAQCALLGESGTGKTSTCRQLARELLQRRAMDPAVPLPIYLDLREVSAAARRTHGLSEVVQSVLDVVYDRPDRARAHDVLALVRRGEGVLIADGLDEVLVHLEQADRHRFARMLWNALQSGGSHSSGKLLMSCRTHLFRTLTEQVNYFTGQERHRVRGADYVGFRLVPLEIEQIERYLELNVPERQVGDTIEILRSVHNLLDLAQRPYLLGKVVDHFDVIERAKASGKSFNAASLYGVIVGNWLDRDEGKHILDPQHKRLLMEDLAAQMARTGESSWAVTDVEQWLAEFIADPAVAVHYEHAARRLLQQDFRTATFVVNEGDDRFRFGHTSIREYFLACYLLRRLLESDFDTWEFSLSSETLDFVAQLLENADSRQARRALSSMETALTTPRPGVNRRLLLYAARAVDDGRAAPTLVNARFDGCDLSGWRLVGTGESRLDLRGACFAGADLSRLRIGYKELDTVSFAGADLTGAVFESVSLVDADFLGTRQVSTHFRDSDLRRASFDGAEFRGAEFVRCRMTDVTAVPAGPPEAFVVDATELGTGPAVTAFTGHREMVYSCSWSPDDTLIASSGDDGYIRIWDAVTQRQIRVIPGHRSGVRRCVWSPDGIRIASVGDDGTARVWDAYSGSAVAVLSLYHHDIVRDCAWSPDSSMLLTVGDDGKVGLWTVEQAGRLRGWQAEQGEVRGCAWSPDGSVVATAGANGTVRLWNPETGRAVLAIAGHTGPVVCCAWSPDGSVLASGGADQTVRLWDARTGKPLSCVSGHTAAVERCSWSPDGTVLATAADDGTVRLWRDGAEVSSASVGTAEALDCAWSADGSMLAAVGMVSAIRVWRSRGAEFAFDLGVDRDSSLMGCSVSPDSSAIVVTGYDDDVIVWAAETGEIRHVLAGHEGTVQASAWSPDGTALVTVDDRLIRLWDAVSGEQRAAFRGHDAEVWGCAWSPDGRRIASTDDAGVVRTWDVESTAELLVLPGHVGRHVGSRYGNIVRGCGWSPDGAVLATCGLDGVRLWDAESGAAVRVLGEPEVYVAWWCAFTADGSTLAIAGNIGACLWDLRSGEVRALSNPVSFHAGAFSPDESMLACGAADGAIVLFDCESGRRLWVAEGHHNAVHGCAWAADGSYLSTVGTDGTLRIWDPDTGTPTRWRAIYNNGSTAVVDGVTGELRSGSYRAWQWLGYQLPLPGGRPGEVVRWPVETFGPVPPQFP